MSDTEQDRSDREIEKLIEDNPMVDGDQLREAHKLLEQLRREGISPPAYAIDSPYQRHPSSSRHSAERSRRR